MNINVGDKVRVTASDSMLASWDINDYISYGDVVTVDNVEKISGVFILSIGGTKVTSTAVTIYDDDKEKDRQKAEELLKAARTSIIEADSIARKYGVKVHSADYGEPYDIFFVKEWDDSACYEDPQAWVSSSQYC